MKTAPGFTRKHHTKGQRDKDLSILGTFINYLENSILITAIFYKLFSLKLMNGLNKLECLSLASQPSVMFLCNARDRIHNTSFPL